MSTASMNAEFVAALARLSGVPLADSDAAARVASGANAAIAAVRRVVGDSLFDYEPSDYLATLEQLADADAAAAAPSP